MANLSLSEAHVMRKLMSNGHDHCTVCNVYPEPVLQRLCNRGWMEPYGPHYRLTTVGKGITLRDLRAMLTPDA